MSAVGKAETSTSPIVYRVSAWSRVILSTVIVAVFAFGAYGSWIFARTQTDAHNRSALASMFLAVFASWILFHLFSALTTSVILSTDQLEFGRFGRTRILRREEIEAWKLQSNRAWFDFLIFGIRGSCRSTTIPRVFPFDQNFRTWLRQIPDLDRIETAASRRAILDDPRFGLTTGERMRTLANARRQGLGLNIAAAIVAAWAFLAPRPYGAAVSVLLALPWIALGIIRWKGGLFRADVSKGDVRRNLTFSIVAPALLLAVRSSDWNLLTPGSLTWIALGIGCMLFAAILSVSPGVRFRTGGLACMGVSSLCYGWGSAALANVLTDHTPASVIAAIVGGKHVSTGKGTTYTVDLNPERMMSKSLHVHVGNAVYNSARAGDRVHLTLRQGALGAEWFAVREWEESRPDAERF